MANRMMLATKKASRNWLLMLNFLEISVCFFAFQFEFKHFATPTIPTIPVLSAPLFVYHCKSIISSVVFPVYRSESVSYSDPTLPNGNKKKARRKKARTRKRRKSSTSSPNFKYLYDTPLSHWWSAASPARHSSTTVLLAAFSSFLWGDAPFDQFATSLVILVVWVRVENFV